MPRWFASRRSNVIFADVSDDDMLITNEPLTRIMPKTHATALAVDDPD